MASDEPEGVEGTGGTSREDADLFGECSDPLNAEDEVDLDRVFAEHPHLARNLAAAIEGLGDLAPALKAAPVPAAIGRFRILREIGRGGMGVVYEAEQPSLERRVALKVLPPGVFTSEKEVERFRREAKAAAKLHHRNIVPVFDVGEEDGVHYYAMQFIAGETLTELIAELRWRQAGASKVGGAGSSTGFERVTGPESPPVPATHYRAAARIGLQAAEALAYAHGEGILHRDIKPSNLLLDAEGTVWVADFGLAKTEGSEPITRTMDFVGTVAYMAPERFLGWSDPRSDVFSLGLTLYELLTLRPAFGDADSTRLMKRVLAEEPPRPRKADPRIPIDFETVVLKAIAKEPGQRYQSAAQLAEDLRALVEDRPIRARRASRPERLWRWCRRNPVTAVFAGTAAALALVVLVVLFASGVKLRERLWDSYVAQARTGRWSRRPGQRLASLDAVAQAAAIRPDRALRDEAIASMGRMDLRVVAEHPSSFTGHAAFGFDANLERYAVDPGDGSISVRRTADGGEVLRIAGPIGRGSFVFSPDSNYLSVSYESRANQPFKVWDLRSGRAVIDLPRAGIGPVAFSPDGRRVAAGRRQGTIDIHDVLSAERQTELACEPYPASLSFDPSGRRLAWATLDSNVLKVIELERQSVALSFTLRDTPTLLAWSPSGDHMACSSWRTDIHVWDLRTGEQRLVLGGHEDQVQFLSFSPVSDLLVSSGFEGMTKLWRPLTGELVLSCPGDVAGLSADGRRLGFRLASDKIAVWEIVSSDECFTIPQGLHGSALGSGGITFTPDGDLLAYAAATAIAFCDVAQAREIAAIPGGQACSVLFEPDGSGLVASGTFGLVRYPLERVESSSHVTWWIAPPRALFAGEEVREVALLPDGRRVAATAYGKGRVLVADRLAEPVFLGNQPLSAHVAASPDGRWIASGTWRGSGVKVWDARSSTLARDLDVRGNAAVIFSPDSQWLLTGTGLEFRFWRAGTWEPGPRIARELAGDVPGPAAFSPDGALLAVTVSRSRVELIDPVSLEVLARLEGPTQPTLANLRFSPDGRLLAAQPAGERERITLWDLERMRKRLAAMGLDWKDRHPARERALEAAPAKALRVRTLEPAALAQDPDSLDRLTERFLAMESAKDYQALRVIVEANAEKKRFREAVLLLEKAVVLGDPDPEALRKLKEYRVALDAHDVSR